MTVNASNLRKNIYRLLDHVLETGEAIEINRKGRRLKIIAEDQPSKLSRLTRHNCLQCDPEEIVHLDWSKEWNDDLP